MEAFTLKSSYNDYDVLVADSDIENDSPRQYPYPSHPLWDFLLRIILISSLAASLAYNGLQARIIRMERHRPDLCRSNYTGLAYDTPMKYETNWGRNETEADEYWNRLDASPVAIVLGDEEARGYGLGPSVPFPWDDEKQIYYIKAFHHIHCLKIIRKAFKTYESGREYKPGNHEHLYHCINTLRQDIMCKPDDTLMPSENSAHVIGDNQIVQCRSWEKLADWAKDPVRNACHKIIEDDRATANILELYAHCPIDSPFYPTVKAYFEKHGHKPMFGDSGESTEYSSSTSGLAHEHGVKGHGY